MTDCGKFCLHKRMNVKWWRDLIITGCGVKYNIIKGKFFHKMMHDSVDVLCDFQEVPVLQLLHFLHDKLLFSTYSYSKTLKSASIRQISLSFFTRLHFAFSGANLNRYCGLPS